jgi:hypothetical protein
VAEGVLLDLIVPLETSNKALGFACVNEDVRYTVC